MKLISEIIRETRERAGYTQSSLAKKLDVTRSSVNAWEMGLSAPSTQFVIEMAKLFHVSTDYLLGIANENSILINLDKLTEKQTRVIYSMLDCFDEKGVTNAK